MVGHKPGESSHRLVLIAATLLIKKRRRNKVGGEEMELSANIAMLVLLLSVRLVADLIRGKKVSQALDILTYTNKKAATGQEKF